MSRFPIQKKSAKAPQGKMYECQAFFTNNHPKRWKYVRDLQSFAQFLSKSHSEWKYFNVYEKGTKLYLKRFYPGNLVPKVLGLLLVLSLSLLTKRNTSSKTFSLLPFHQESNLENTTSSKTASNTSTNGFNYTATISTAQISKKEVIL